MDVFVNNAGTGDGVKFLDLDLDTWMRTLDTNLNGAFVCLQAAARRMVKAGRGGRIIAVTSVHEFQPRVGASAYDASKHGLGGLIKTMALELAEYGITANSVAPGEIATPMTGQTDQDPTQDRPARGSPGKAGRCPGGGGRHRLPGLPGLELRHRRFLGSGRRHAADGPAGRFAHHRPRLAQKLARPTCLSLPQQSAEKLSAKGGACTDLGAR